MNVKDAIRRHTALLSIVIMAFACGQANSRSPAPAPTPAPTTTTTAPKKPKKTTTGSRTTPASRPPASTTTPASTNTVATTTTKTLSGDFSINCARCHGQSGDGSISIRGKSLQEFKAAVRSGRGSMPSFSESQYSDASLKSDQSVLSGN